jgi:hypothetical protein
MLHQRTNGHEWPQEADMKATAGRVTVAALAALMAGTSIAATERPVPQLPADDDACVFFRTLYDWQVLDDRHLLIWAPGKRDPYQVELATPLNGLRFAHTLAFVDRNGDGMLCGFGMDRIALTDTPIHEDATIAGMTRLDATTLAAVAEHYGVKISPRRVAAAQRDPDTDRRL